MNYSLLLLLSHYYVVVVVTPTGHNITTANCIPIDQLLMCTIFIVSVHVTIEKRERVKVCSSRTEIEG